MRLTAELCRRRMPAGRAVTLADGAIVELDADVEAPIDLFVNGVRFGRGQLLVTEDGDWAVRVDEIFTPTSDPNPNDSGGTAQWPVFSS
jgi:flagellar motor switch protein FliN/FliY